MVNLNKVFDAKRESMQVLKPRLFFVDNLRTFVIILVFLVHIAITYGAAGLWYYKEGELVGLQYCFSCLYLSLSSVLYGVAVSFGRLLYPCIV